MSQGIRRLMIILLFRCRRILVAQQAIGGLILLDGGEAPGRRVEVVVGVVVIALADLADEHRAGAGLDVEVVVEPLGDGQAHAGLQLHLGAGGHHPGLAVHVDGDVAFAVHGLVLMGVEHADEQVAARKSRQVQIEELAGKEVWIDGFNTIITYKINKRSNKNIISKIKDWRSYTKYS